MEKLNKTDIELFLRILAPEHSEYTVIDDQLPSSVNLNNASAFGNKEVSNAVIVTSKKANSIHTADAELIFCSNKTQAELKEFGRTQLYYFKNNDGTMRWVFPNDLKRPTFLNFYSATSLKAKLFVYTIKLLFLFRLQHLGIFNSFTIYHKNELLFSRLNKELNTHNFSLFTGTVGVNRKVLIEFNNNNRTAFFAKIPIGSSSAKLISNERDRLKALNTESIHSFVYPLIVNVDNTPGMLIQNNMNSKKVKRSAEWQKPHTQYLIETINNTIQTTRLNESSFWARLGKCIENQSKLKQIFLSQDLYCKLIKLYHTFDVRQNIKVGRIHGDFTPWNLFIENDKLKAYDWELSKSDYPVLFDLFHFVFQSKILLKHQSYNEIKAALNKLEQQPEIHDLLIKHQIDFNEQLKLYLLVNTANYLLLYRNQSKLHTQAYWLLNNWNLALDALLNDNIIFKTQRETFIKSSFQFLNDQEIPYAVLKTTNKNILHINHSSDVDILIEKNQVNQYLELLNNFCYINKFQVSRKSNLTTCNIFFNDHSFLSVDLVTNFKRKHLQYLNPQTVLNGRIFDNRGFYRLKEKFDLDYILNFYLLNNSSIPEHYINYFNSLPELTQHKISIYFKQKYAINFLHTSELFNNLYFAKTTLTNSVYNAAENNGVLKLKNILTYGTDVIKGIVNERGYVITLSGVDGVGKSTLLENTKNYLEKSLRKKVVVLRHRPSILPILSAYKYGKEGAEQRSVSKLPRSGNNKNLILSVVRFAYYLVDYVVGQWYVVFKYLIRGKIVLYDRYYFDFIADPKRTNLSLPSWIPRFFYTTLLKPKLNLFLYAQPDVILKRKQELSADVIEELTDKYQDSFNRYHKKFTRSKYYCIENIELNDTLKTIKQLINQIA